ncbi:MAG: hypothetical protein M5U34_39590 [Chloroflexi bacterium]|nr:hypothetical protein [Chloroflexota bacterium]
MTLAVIHSGRAISAYLTNHFPCCAWTAFSSWWRIQKAAHCGSLPTKDMASAVTPMLQYAGSPMAATPAAAAVPPASDPDWLVYRAPRRLDAVTAPELARNMHRTIK